MLDEGAKILWGDTVSGNIRRYLQRYFEPALKSQGIPYAWHKQDATLTVGGGYVDFRSADRPENWEGFGYDHVFLNEAGIILDDPYLWHNAVLPMMLDNPASTLIAAGTPKLSTMTGLLFKDLWDRCVAGEAGYHGRRFSSRDNPFLNQEAISELEEQIAPAERPQEIDGEFVEPGSIGSFFQRDWFQIIEAETAPRVVRTVRGWDFAATEPSVSNQNPDWTVGALMGVTEAGQVVILDMVMDRKGPPGVDALLERTKVVDGPGVTQVIPLDPAAAGKTAEYHFRSHPLKGVPVSTDPQTSAQGSKATRATPFSIAAGAAARGKPGVLVVKAPWNGWMFSQLTPFPNPKVHDDAVDALAAAYNALSTGTLAGGLIAVGKGAAQ
jgi:predicted phage terminase large subunit-like protein